MLLILNCKRVLRGELFYFEGWGEIVILKKKVNIKYVRKCDNGEKYIILCIYLFWENYF